MMGSVDEDRIPSSTRIWRAERAKKRTIPLVLSAAAGRRSGGERPLSTYRKDCCITVVAQPYKAGRRTRPVGRGPAHLEGCAI